MTDTVSTDGGADSESPMDTWRVRMGEDGDPTRVRDSEGDITAVFEREDGADSGEATVTYCGPDGEELTISPGDTILGPDGEDVVDVATYSVTYDPYIAVEMYVDIPPEHGGGVPMSPEHFAKRFLGYEDNDGLHFHIGECEAASGEELEKIRWSDELETLWGLDEGDTIRWGDRSDPLTVTDTGITVSQYVIVEGSRGGEYAIQWRDGVPSVRSDGMVDGRSLGRPHGLEVVDRADGE